MAEVFKTNVQQDKQAKKLIAVLYSHFPDSKINFDLEDCDKILRVEGRNVTPQHVVSLIEKMGFNCAELE